MYYIIINQYGIICPYNIPLWFGDMGKRGKTPNHVPQRDFIGGGYGIFIFIK